jgi:hypothetical protein
MERNPVNAQESQGEQRSLASADGVPSATLRKTSSAEACGGIQAVVPCLRSRRATL